MTRRVSDLIEFMNDLKKLGYRTQIPIQHLRFFIGQKIGTSDYVQKTVLKNLVEFGFLKTAGIGIFYICDGWNPNETKENIAEAEKAAAKEADAILRNVRKGKVEK